MLLCRYVFPFLTVSGIMLASFIRGKRNLAGMPSPAQKPDKNTQAKESGNFMFEQILGWGLSLVVWVGSTVAMVIGFGLKPVKWLRKAL